MTTYSIYLVLLIIFALSLRKPFGFVLAYAWLEYFRPQQVEPLVFADSRVMLVFAAAAMLSVVFHRCENLAGRYGVLVGLFLLAGWIGITTWFAVVPEMAGPKFEASWPLLVMSMIYLVAMKDIRDLYFYCIAVFIGAWVHILTAGFKSIFGGAGYGYALGIAKDNFGLAESSTLGAMAISFIPFIFFMNAIGQVAGYKPANRKVIGGFVFLLLMAMFGSYSRAGVVSLVVGYFLAALLWPKRAIAAVPVIVALGIFVTLAGYLDPWFERIATVSTYEEDESATNRLVVWKHTLEYIAGNPLGGGFYVNRSWQIPTEASSGTKMITGVGFHSIVFEVLGEHGLPGVLLYFGLIVIGALRLFAVRRAAIAKKQLEIRNAATSMLLVWAIYLSGAAFVAVSFMPYTFTFLCVTFVFCSVVKQRELKSD